MINVFFPYYSCGDTERQQEIDLSLKNNIDNPHISRLIVLVDDGSNVPYTSTKLRIIHSEQRPTYRYWIELSNQLELDGVSLLCNSDIYFDETLPIVADIINAPDTFLALSRWEYEAGKISLHKNPHWSQDVWAYHMSASFTKEMLASLDFPMGVPRCDNKIAYLFAIRGWRIFNPCQALKSIHLHETQLRTYEKKLDDRIIGSVAYVYPGENYYDEASLQIDVWTKRSTSITKVMLNKAMERWIAESEKINSAPPIKSQPARLLFPATSAELLQALKEGELLYSNSSNFKILKSGDIICFFNLYELERRYKTTQAIYERNPKNTMISALIPPVIKTHINAIGVKPLNPQDINFWQYPCATERQAYENHLAIESPDHVNAQKKIVDTYLPLPWATYIDKKSFPDEYLTRIKTLIGKYREIAQQSGFVLNVHSVCQHIYWTDILEKCAEIGVTNLHLSHKDSTSESKQKEVGTSLKLHGWPLIAVNYEIKERSAGMERKPMAERKLLTSFIGAHMPHYRNNSRIQLFEAAKKSGRDDVFVDLGNEWHFNKIVYQEQVLNKKVDAAHLSEHDEKTFRYNSILSDSKFSLCPEGAGPNTLRFWESIAVGSIPILFSDDVSIFSEDETGKEILKNIFIWKKPIDLNLFEFLSKIDPMEAQKKSEQLIKLYTFISSKKIIV